MMGPVAPIANIAEPMPLASLDAAWLTYKHIDLPQLACTWLIRRFIQPDAIFRFAPRTELNSRSARTFGFPGAAFGGLGPPTETSRRTFQELVQAFGLGADDARDALCEILTGTLAARDAFGLRRLLESVRMREGDDQAFVEAASRFCDAYYEWARANPSTETGPEPQPSP